MCDNTSNVFQTERRIHSVKLQFPPSDKRGMVQANPSVAPIGAALPYPEAGALSDPRQRFALFADLMHVVTWELEIPGQGVRWHAPASDLFGDDLPAGSFLVRRARDSDESDPFES